MNSNPRIQSHRQPCPNKTTCRSLIHECITLEHETNDFSTRDRCLRTDGTHEALASQGEVPVGDDVDATRSGGVYIQNVVGIVVQSVLQEPG
jgi:hypothetical protein